MDPTIVCPNEGLADQLDYILSAPIPGVAAWVLVLYTTADLVPGQYTVWADVAEATFSGYSRRILDRSTWTASTIIMSQAVSTYGATPCRWVNTGSPQTITGWAIITPVASVIRYIQPLPAPLVLDTGDPIEVLPQVALTTLPPVVMGTSRGRGGSRARTRRRM
jgi:hypothetical protein